MPIATPQEMTPINQGIDVNGLRAAGFNDQEISDYAKQRRDELRAAGFSDGEIDSYMSGGPQVTKEPPQSLVNRVANGIRFAREITAMPQFIQDAPTEAITNTVDTIKGIYQNLTPPELGGTRQPGKEGTVEGLKKTGGALLSTLGVPFAPIAGALHSVVGHPIVWADEALRKAATALYGEDKVAQAEQAAGRQSGPLSYEEAKSWIDTALMGLQAKDALRVEFGPTGEPRTVGVGGLPKSEDFANATKSVAGDKPPKYVQDKIKQAYDEGGMHPAEVAHEAASDPVIKQQLLSSDKGITAYRNQFIDNATGGGPPEKPPTTPPPAGAEPPKPPSAQETILNKISIGGKEPSAKWTLNKLYTQVIDDLHPLRGVSEDAYTLARLTRGQFGKAEHFLEHGTFDFKNYQTNGPALSNILKPVQSDLNGLRAYLASKRALEIEASGRTSGMDLAAAKEVVANGTKFEGIAKQLGQYQSNLLKYLKDSGVLSEDSFKAMQQANKDYVPFYRLMTEFNESAGGPKTGKGFGPGSPIKKLTGSERAIIDPLESIIKNTYAYISIAERNDVGIALIDALKAAGHDIEIGKVVSVVKDASFENVTAYLKQQGIENPPEQLIALMRDLSAKEDGSAIAAFKNGVRESVRVNDPELVRAFRQLDQQSTSMLVKILKVPAKLLRAGATITPDFIARNLIRDFQTAFVYTKGGLFSPVDTARGLKGVLTKDVDFQNWLKSGGANATWVGLDRSYLHESLQKLTQQTGLMSRSWNVVKNPLMGLRMISELAENATRLGEFKKVMAKQGVITKEAIQAAGYSSREVTLDFSRIGASMRAYNMITAFANAQIQGVDRLARAFKDAPATTTAKIAAGITLPSVLLWWANHKDPRYKEIPQWERDLFWIVMTKEHIYRIPKPFEVGVIFGSGPERILDRYVDQNPNAYDQLSNSIMTALSPSFIPTIAQPIVEQFANRSTFTDRTLIPQSMEQFLPEYQYTPYTTEISKALGKVIAAMPGIRENSIDQGSITGPFARAATSPILIENYIRSWTGGMGTYAMQAADAALRKQGILPDPIKPTPTLADIPFIKAFAVRYPSGSAQSIQDFYDKHNRNNTFYTTWLTKAKEGDADAVQRIMKAGGMTMFVRMDAIKNVLSQQSNLIRNIYKNPAMPADEKRQLIDGLYYKMIEIARSGKEAMDQADKALKQPELVQ